MSTKRTVETKRDPCGCVLKIIRETDYAEVMRRVIQCARHRREDAQALLDELAQDDN